MSDNITPEDRVRRSKQITKVNKTINNRVEKIEKSRLSKMKPSRKSYSKFYGRHLHRVIAEKMLGRKLTTDEVVHHIDGNKQNNEPENLQVMTRSEHILEHLRWGGGRLCSSCIDIKK